MPAPTSGQVGAAETFDGFAAARLRDGGAVFLRPLRDGEREPVLDVFQGLSPTSRYLRFLAPMPRLPSTILRSLTRLDQWNRVAWGVRADRQWAGIGRYVRVADDADTAELALSIVDAQQGRGLGRLLLDTLAIVGAANGVRTFCWQIHPHNIKASSLAESLGGLLQPAGGVCEGQLMLTGRHSSNIDHTEIVRLAASSRTGRIPTAA